HGAADRIAAVERALRPAQHLDALDVVDLEHRALRTVQIDVVEVDADALLEARNGILLTDAANEGAQGGVGAARSLERSVGSELGDLGYVDRATLAQFAGIERGDGNGDIQQPLLTPACGHDDRAAFLGLADLFRRFGRGILGERRRDECLTGERGNTANAGKRLPQQNLTHRTLPLNPLLWDS